MSFKNLFAVMAAVVFPIVGFHSALAQGDSNVAKQISDYLLKEAPYYGPQYSGDHKYQEKRTDTGGDCLLEYWTCSPPAHCGSADLPSAVTYVAINSCPIYDSWDSCNNPFYQAVIALDAQGNLLSNTTDMIFDGQNLSLTYTGWPYSYSGIRFDIQLRGDGAPSVSTAMDLKSGTSMTCVNKN